MSGIPDLGLAPAEGSGPSPATGPSEAPTGVGLVSGSYVVDTSVALKWYIPEGLRAEALLYLGPGVDRHAPDYLLAEAGGALLKRVRSVADQLAGRTRKVRGPPSGEPVAAVVARGEADIGFQQVPELIHVPGTDFVGTLPSEAQPPTLFVGALPKNSQHPDVGIDLLKFLSSADAAAVITKAGLKPLSSR